LREDKKLRLGTAERRVRSVSSLQAVDLENMLQPISFSALTPFFELARIPMSFIGTVQSACVLASLRLCVEVGTDNQNHDPHNPLRSVAFGCVSLSSPMSRKAIRQPSQGLARLRKPRQGPRNKNHFVPQSFCPSREVVKPSHPNQALMPPQKPKNSRLHPGHYRLIQVCKAFPEFSLASSLIIAFHSGHPSHLRQSAKIRGEKFPWCALVGDGLLKSEFNKLPQTCHKPSLSLTNLYKVKQTSKKIAIQTLFTNLPDVA
jgi:hypothetical protein